MTTPSSSASESQYTYSNPSYFPVPFHLQQPATTHYAAPYVATPSVQPSIVGPVAPVAGVYSTVPQYQAQQLFERDAQIITPEALENVKAAIASSDVEHKADSKRKAVPHKVAGQSWEDPILAEWPEDDYRLFCGDLGNEVNDDVLSKAFSRFPSFNLARVVRDKRTGKTKGYGFVSFANPADLAAALKEMNGKYVGNRPIKLRKSKWKERTDYEALEKQKVEIPNYHETGNAKQVGVKGDSAVTVDDSATTMSEVDADQNSTSFLKSAYGAEPVDFEVGSVTNFDPETNVNNGTAQPVHPDNALDRMKEPPKNGEGSFFDSNKGLELIDNSLRVSTDLGFKSVLDNKAAEFELDPFSNILPDPGARNAHKFQPKIKPRPRACNTPAIASASSNVMTEKSVELPTSCENDFQSFQSSGDGSGGLNQSTSLPLPASEILRTTDLSNKFDYMSSSIPFSEDNKSLESAIPSQLDSLNAMLSEDAVHNGTRDWPSSYGKSSGEAADIFSGLESLDDFITQAATDTGKPALHSFNEKGAKENFATPASNSINSFGECVTTQDTLTFDEGAVPNEDDTHTNNRSETEEAVGLNPDCPGDDVFDYHSMKSDEDPTSGIPVHDELTNVADSPRLADLLQADVTREKQDSNERKKDDSTQCSVRKNRRSSIAGEEDKGGKTSRKLRKQAARKPANSSLNEDVEDNDDLDPPYNSNGDEFQENDDDYEVDYSSKKRRASTSSKNKSVAKSGKTSQKRKKANDDSEKTTKPKKFSRSTRRKKRCVDKALLEIPEDELDPRTLPIKDIILLAEHRERLAKKEAMTSGASSTCQSGGDPFHEAGANNEEEFSGSEDDRDPYEDQATEVIPTASTLFNYQSFMEKAPRGKWSKQDTELFYEAVRELGTDFSMIQQLFPGKTRHQIKLKYKKEERENPSLLTDAVNNRAKDHSHYKLLIERLQDASNKAEEDPSRDASDFMAVDEVLDLTPATNNEEAAEVATTKQEDDVKAQEDSVAVPSPEQSDDSEDDFQKWSQYKSVFDE